MQVRYDEGVAIHIDLEPCAVACEGGMRYSKARAGLRTGKACPRRWIAYDKQQDRERRKSSPRSYTTSARKHLEAAFFELKENAAPGVDGLTWRAYEEGLDAKILDLHSRLHKGAYRALPSRRIYIPKPDGRQRPLAVAALEDKIVQRATIGKRCCYPT